MASGQWHYAELSIGYFLAVGAPPIIYDGTDVTPSGGDGVVIRFIGLPHERLFSLTRQTRNERRRSDRGLRAAPRDRPARGISGYWNESTLASRQLQHTTTALSPFMASDLFRATRRRFMAGRSAYQHTCATSTPRPSCHSATRSQAMNESPFTELYSTTPLDSLAGEGGWHDPHEPQRRWPRLCGRRGMKRSRKYLTNFLFGTRQRSLFGLAATTSLGGVARPLRRLGGIR